ncbi:MAG TPA: NAD-binding protein [Thermodesulfobacteriota bacterium]|nr:NAD-binding protein [Thermodesulfobacteriota bacterium]
MYIIVIGAGKVGYHLARLLMTQSHGHEVMVIEKDRSKVDLLAVEFHDAIMEGDGSTVEALKEAGANRADVVVATTGNDEDNLVICQVVKLMFLRPRTIARVNNPRNEELFTGLGVDASVSGTKLINAIIHEQVQAGDMMIPLLTLKAGDIEIVEVQLTRSSHIVKKKIKDLTLPAGSIFIAVIRGEEVIIPYGETDFQPEDKVLALVKRESEEALRKML